MRDLAIQAGQHLFRWSVSGDLGTLIKMESGKHWAFVVTTLHMD